MLFFQIKTRNNRDLVTFLVVNIIYNSYQKNICQRRDHPASYRAATSYHPYRKRQVDAEVEIPADKAVCEDSYVAVPPLQLFDHTLMF